MKRLLADDATPLERRLLLAVRAETPSSAHKRNVRRAIGLGFVRSLGRRSGARSNSATLAGITCMIAAGAVAGASAFDGVNETAEVVAVVDADRPLRWLPKLVPPRFAAPLAEKERSVDEPAERAAGAESKSQEPARSAQDSEDGARSLRDQIVAIDRARAALSRGNAESTLQRLNEYRRNFPDGAFNQEAFVLKVEALFALGRRREAAMMAARFIEDHPTSAVTKRLERFAGSR